MDARQRIDQDTDNLANLYANLEDMIFTEIIKVLQRGNYTNVTKDNVIQWQAKQLSQMGALTKRTIDLMADFDEIKPEEIAAVLKQDGYEILEEVSQELKYSDQKSQSISNESMEMLDSMVRQTTDTLNNTINQTLISHNYGVNPVMRTYQEIIKRSTIATVTELKTHDRAVKDAIYQQIDKGITVMQDKAGRNWSLEGYTNMVLRTTANRTYNDLRTKRMQEFGQSLCVMSSHPNSRPACAYIQGKIVNIVPQEDPTYNPKYDTIYNHEYGEPSGTLGINCRHKLFPFTPGVNINNMPQYDPKDAIRNGEFKQKQRYYERSIRDAKKHLKVAQELGDDDMVTRTKTLISARQKNLREFIKETNEKYGKQHDILTRDYDREQIYSKSILRESGAIRKRTQSFVDFEPLADGEDIAREMYIQFAQRKSEPLIERISKVGNISLKDAKEIYDHVFVDKHLTLDEDNNKIMAKFDPDPDMAQSFQRIFNRQKLYDEDIMLLKHELYERKLMKENPDMIYYDAHELTKKKYDYKAMVDKRKGLTENDG